MIRIFSAVPVSESLSTQLAQVQTEISGIRWIDPSFYHTTVLFMGEVNVYLYRQIKQQMKSLVFNTSISKVIGLEVLNDKQGLPKVLCAKIEPNKALQELYSNSVHLIRTLYPELQIKFHFKPQITLARLKQPDLSSLNSLLEYYSETEFGEIETNQFCLYSSRPTNKGSVYTKLESYHSPVSFNEENSYS